MLFCKNEKKNPFHLLAILRIRMISWVVVSWFGALESTTFNIVGKVAAQGGDVKEQVIRASKVVSHPIRTLVKGSAKEKKNNSII